MVKWLATDRLGSHAARLLDRMRACNPSKTQLETIYYYLAPNAIGSLLPCRLNLSWPPVP